MQKVPYQSKGVDELFPNLTQRHVQPELMDQPDLDPKDHHQALQGLRRVNWWSRTVDQLYSAILEIKGSQGNPMTILDVATGGGDIPIGLWKKTQRRGLAWKISGCDFSQTAIDHANSLAAASKAEVDFFRHNFLVDPIPQQYDVVISSLFLHHIQFDQVTAFLSKLKQSTRRLLLISDLRRCLSGWIFAWVGTRILSRSPIVHVDGPLSVCAAFTTGEAAALAKQVGLTDAVVQRKWPFRFLLSWVPPLEMEGKGPN